jgi:hypothetical protein
LRAIAPANGEPGSVAINAAIHRAAGFPEGNGSADIETAAFPTPLVKLSLDDLIGLILAIGSLGAAQSKQSKFAATDLDSAVKVGRRAATALADWPRCFHDSLRRLLPSDPANAGEITFQRTFGSFYQYLLDASKHSQFVFLREAFEQFAVQDWPGVLRGQHRLVASAAEHCPLVPALRAAKTACVTSSQVAALVRNGDLNGHWVTTPKSRKRKELWVDRDSLSRWIAKRDRELADYMSQGEAKSALGLTSTTIMSVARSGLIRFVKGEERGFPQGIHFFRKDIAVVQRAFSTCPVDPRQLILDREISLRDAVRTQLRRDGLSRFIRAVIDGELAPTRRTPSIPGILGSMFRLEQVKKYRPVRVPRVIPPGCLTYAEVAAKLGTNTEVVRNLVAQGFLHPPKGRSRGAKLVRMEDVESFATRFVSVSSIAERFKTRSAFVARHLKQRGTAVVEISLPGKGKKLFARKGPASETAILALRVS